MGFKASHYPDLARVEDNYFWFGSRNKLIIWALNRYFPGFENLLEVGCGTGYVLSGIGKAFPSARIVGSEIFVAGLAFAAERLPEALLIQMDARHIPYADEFDVAAAFDVLEHIDDDEAVLQNMYRTIKPGGGLLITVPQHRWLWSYNDDHACHVRRYDRDELHRKINAAGFAILFSTSFVSLLLPVMMLSRGRRKSIQPPDPLNEFHISPLTNLILAGVSSLERALIRLGITFPVGGSRLVIARKLL
jgi:ubiquinone/menaquinone biosynthesis C-methylase UbiE